MLKITNPAARWLAMATFLGTTVAASPLLAQTNSPATAQADGTQAAPPDAGKPAPRAKASRVDRTEARIKQLHDQLRITAAQEPQWDGVAQAMRDDATAMQSAIAQRRQNRGKMSAVDDLRSYEQVAETHVAGLQKLIPAFEALYGTMSADQKKNADTVFGHPPGRGRKPAQQQ
jgi:periplasmic protein CpxP/Spy